MKSLTREEAKEYIGKQVYCWSGLLKETATEKTLVFIANNGEMRFVCEDEYSTNFYEYIAPYAMKEEPKMSVSEHVSSYLDTTENDGQMTHEFATLLTTIGEEIDALKKRVEMLERDKQIML